MFQTIEAEKEEAEGGSWPRTRIYVSMEGSLTSVNNSLSSQYVCLALQHFHRSLSQTLILEKRMFV